MSNYEQEIAELKAALASIHDALGEARESDDANLGAIVAEIVADLKQRTIALDEANAALAERTGQVSTLTEALSQVEYVVGAAHDVCPWCLSYEWEGDRETRKLIHKPDCPRQVALSSPPVAAMGRVIEAVRALVRQQEVIGYPRGLQYDARFHELVDTARAAGLGGE